MEEREERLKEPERSRAPQENLKSQLTCALTDTELPTGEHAWVLGPHIHVTEV